MHVRTYPIRIGDRLFQISSDDEYPKDMQGVFEPETVELFQSLVKPGALALDVGANIGCTVLLLSQLARQTVSFEPSPSTFAFLRQNVQAGAGNVETVNAGLGREPADLNIVFFPSHRSGGFVSSEKLAGHVMEPIRILNGDAFVRTALAGARVDFIKIDVEGFELEVLAGLSETIAADRPVVTLELNHWCLNAFQRMSVPAFLDVLLERFPLLYAVHDGHAMVLRDSASRYHVTSRHIMHFEYMSLVGAFDEASLPKFIDRFIRSPRPRRERQDLGKKFEELETTFAEVQAALRAERTEAARREEELERLKRELADGRARQQSLAQQLEAMRRSTSWRVTRPLRAVKDLIR